MFTINLISPTYKKIQKVKQILSNIKTFFLSTTLFIAISAIAILLAKKFLFDNYITMIKNTAYTSTSQTERKKINQINQKIKLAENIQKDYIAWSKIIITLSNIIPDGIVINSLNITPTTTVDEWNIHLAGLAHDRDTFMNLKDKLSPSTDLFTKTTFPLTGIIKKNDIAVNIDLTINRKNLNNLITQ